MARVESRSGNCSAIRMTRSNLWDYRPLLEDVSQPLDTSQTADQWVRTDENLVHQTLMSCSDFPQVAEGRCGCSRHGNQGGSGSTRSTRYAPSTSCPSGHVRRIRNGRTRAAESRDGRAAAALYLAFDRTARFRTFDVLHSHPRELAADVRDGVECALEARRPEAGAPRVMSVDVA
jgi:hypothetical protein